MNAFRAAATALMCLTLHAVQAQVTYVDKVPSVQDLQAMLKKQQAAQATPAAVRPPGSPATRQIVWDDPNAAPRAAEPPGAGGATGVSANQQVPAPGPAVAMPINFDINSSRVSGPSLGYVEVVAKLLAADPSLQLAIEGHTDALGSLQKNLPLSWERALSVYRLLVDRYGIDARRLHPAGRGSLEPLEGVTPVAPMNRRVQFRVIG